MKKFDQQHSQEPGQDVREEGLNFRSLILLKTSEFCQMLHITPRTALEWRRDGVVPYIRIQGRIYYRLSDVLNVLDLLREHNKPNTEKK